MPIFKVAWTELYGFEANVAARDLEHAIQLVKDDSSLYAGNNFSGEYVDGTMEINKGFTEWLNSEANDANRVCTTPETSIESGRMPEV
jgi:hypothetical protein